MKISHEVPKCLLNNSREFNDYDYCLPHLLDKDEHYRNFTNLEYLMNLLKEHNFKILFSVESNGFSIYKDEDPVCIRVICRKI